MAQIKLLDEAAHDEPLFKNGQLDALVGTAARILIARGQTLPASVLVHGDLSVRYLGHDNWNGGQNNWRLNIAVPVPTYCDLGSRPDIETWIDEALIKPAASLSDIDFLRCEITAQLERDPDWRQKARQSLAGEGITNQGRVHSENVAAARMLPPSSTTICCSGHGLRFSFTGR